MKKFISSVLCLIAAIVGIYLMIDGISGIIGDKKDIKSIVKINETISDKDGVEFCVKNVRDDKTVGSGYGEATTENNYITVSISIINKGNDPYNINALRFLLIEGSKEYQYSEETIYSYDNYMTMDTINPGISKEYRLVYETPNTSTENEYILKIKPIGLSDKDSLYITLK